MTKEEIETIKQFIQMSGKFQITGTVGEAVRTTRLLEKMAQIATKYEDLLKPKEAKKTKLETK